MDQNSSRPRPNAPPDQNEASPASDFRVSSPFIVQIAASHAGIGPYRAYFREVAAVAAARYRAVDISDRCRA